MQTVAIDARMIRHSGIGVVLKGLLRHWAEEPPFFRIALCGPRGLLEQECPKELDAEIIDWRANVYTFSAALSRPKLPKNTAAWYSPHYATCLRPGVPLVCHVQDVLHYTHPQKAGSRLYNHLYLSALRMRASFFLTTTRHVKVQLQTLFHFPAHRVLCTGLGAGVFDDRRELLQGSVPSELRGKRYILAVGIDKPHKNWDFLLEHFSRIGNEELYLAAGGLGPGRERIEETARESGLTNRIIFLPRLSEQSMAAVYTNAFALAYPSIAEGFGLPILEALAAGVPVIAANRSPMKEIAADCGYYFDPDYPDSFVNAFELLSNDDQLRRERIESGRRLASGYTWRKTAGHVEDALYRAIEGKLPPPRR